MTTPPDLDLDLAVLGEVLDRDLAPDAGDRLTASLLGRLAVTAPPAARAAGAPLTLPAVSPVTDLAVPATRPSRITLAAAIAATAAAVVVLATVVTHQASTSGRGGGAGSPLDAPVTASSGTDAPPPVDTGPVDTTPISFSDDDVYTRTAALNAQFRAAGVRAGIVETTGITIPDVPAWTCTVEARKGPPADVRAFQTETTATGATVHVVHPEYIAPGTWLVLEIPRGGNAGMIGIDTFYDGIPACVP